MRNYFHGWPDTKWWTYITWSKKNFRKDDDDIEAYIARFDVYWAAQRLTSKAK